MIRVHSALDAWWQLAGIFSGGMLGLFFLGLGPRRIRSAAAAAGVVAGVLVILWMTFSPGWTGRFEPYRSPFHSFLIIVLGTATIVVVGFLLGQLGSRRPGRSQDKHD